ncbi:MAG: hypothetical protein IH624_04780 [Phycisphaerae bacterium]|nr:hypothetical protein [Phycisphaerae bacterium]
MKTRPNEKGFILFLAVAMIPLIGVAMLLLTGGVGIMAGEEKLTRRQACREDLLASGRAWADHNRNRLAASETGIAVPLDVTEFGLKHAMCSVTLDGITEGEIQVTIEVRADDRTRPRRKHMALKVEKPFGPAIVVEPAAGDPNAIFTDACQASSAENLPVLQDPLREHASADPNALH